MTPNRRTERFICDYNSHSLKQTPGSGELGSLSHPDPGAAKMALSGSVDLGPEGNKSYIGATSGYFLLLCLVSPTPTAVSLHRWVLFVCFMDQETETVRIRNLPKPCLEKNPRLQNPGLCAFTTPSPAVCEKSIRLFVAPQLPCLWPLEPPPFRPFYL